MQYALHWAQGLQRQLPIIYIEMNKLGKITKNNQSSLSLSRRAPGLLGQLRTAVEVCIHYKDTCDDRIDTIQLSSAKIIADSVWNTALLNNFNLAKDVI